MRTVASWLLLIAGGAVLLVGIAGRRLSVVTDYAYHAFVKDPERHAPQGNVLVSPADGHVLYVKRFEKGMLPPILKRGVEIPVFEHLKMEPVRPLQSGYLVGIYMNTQGVHVNRAPDTSKLVRRHVFNGPHMDMTRFERSLILGQLVPGWVTLKKLLGMSPYELNEDADFILKSARETLVFEDAGGNPIYLVRIADYYVGKILTWIAPKQEVARGEKIGMITWGSQSDLLFESRPDLRITVQEGDYVYAGETPIARYGEDR